MPNLPIIQHPDQAVMLMQRNWKSKLDPVISNPMLNGKTLTNVQLVQGSNVIAHNLGSQPTGWQILDVQGPANVYRSGTFDKTNITLTATAGVTISFQVF